MSESAGIENLVDIDHVKADNEQQTSHKVQMGYGQNCAFNTYLNHFNQKTEESMYWKI